MDNSCSVLDTNIGKLVSWNLPISLSPNFIALFYVILFHKTAFNTELKYFSILIQVNMINLSVFYFYSAATVQRPNFATFSVFVTKTNQPISQIHTIETMKASRPQLFICGITNLVCRTIL